MRYFFLARPAESRTRIVGWCFSSPGGSVTPSCERPVTSSTCFSIVMPGCRSLNSIGPPAPGVRENPERVRIPLDHRLAERNGFPVFHLGARAVNQMVAFFFAALFVDD